MARAELRTAEHAAVRVHGLAAGPAGRPGRPLCGFTRHGLAAWPAGHLWVDPARRGELINCPGCQRLVPEYLAERRPRP